MSSLRFNPSLPHGNMSPPWHGASFKQNGHYFSADGELVITPNSPKDGGAPLPAAATTGSIPVLDWDIDGVIVRIDGVPYVQLEVAQQWKKAATQGIPATSGPMTSTKRAQAAVGVQAKVPASAPVVDTGPDDLMLIKGMTPEILAVLAKIGIASFGSIAALSKDEVTELTATLEPQGVKPGQIDADNWIPQATALLAEKHPERVRHTSTLELVSAELTLANLVAWAKRDGENYHWQKVRKAFFDVLATRVANETDAVAALIKAGHLTQDEAKR